MLKGVADWSRVLGLRGFICRFSLFVLQGLACFGALGTLGANGALKGVADFIKTGFSRLDLGVL